MAAPVLLRDPSSKEFLKPGDLFQDKEALNAAIKTAGLQVASSGHCLLGVRGGKYVEPADRHATWLCKWWKEKGSCPVKIYAEGTEMGYWKLVTVELAHNHGKVPDTKRSRSRTSKEKSISVPPPKVEQVEPEIKTSMPQVIRVNLPPSNGPKFRNFQSSEESKSATASPMPPQPEEEFTKRSLTPINEKIDTPPVKRSLSAGEENENGPPKKARVENVRETPAELFRGASQSTVSSMPSPPEVSLSPEILEIAATLRKEANCHDLKVAEILVQAGLPNVSALEAFTPELWNVWLQEPSIKAQVEKLSTFAQFCLREFVTLWLKRLQSGKE